MFVRHNIAEQIAKGLFLSNAGTSGLGGAVCVNQVDTLSIDSSTNFTSNTCIIEGGALHVLSTNAVHLEGTVFSKNRANVGAAVAAIDVNTFVVKDIKALKNKASVGGIIDARKAKSSQAVNCVIQENQGSGLKFSLVSSD